MAYSGGGRSGRSGMPRIAIRTSVPSQVIPRDALKAADPIMGIVVAVLLLIMGYLSTAATLHGSWEFITSIKEFRGLEGFQQVSLWTWIGAFLIQFVATYLQWRFSEDRWRSPQYIFGYLIDFVPTAWGFFTLLASFFSISYFGVHFWVVPIVLAAAAANSLVAEILLIRSGGLMADDTEG